jgi:hypothetical protein
MSSRQILCRCRHELVSEWSGATVVQVDDSSIKKWSLWTPWSLWSLSSQCTQAELSIEWCKAPSVKSWTEISTVLKFIRGKIEYERLNTMILFLGSYLSGNVSWTDWYCYIRIFHWRYFVNFFMTAIRANCDWLSVYSCHFDPSVVTALSCCWHTIINQGPRVIELQQSEGEYRYPDQDLAGKASSRS